MAALKQLAAIFNTSLPQQKAYFQPLPPPPMPKPLLQPQLRPVVVLTPQIKPMYQAMKSPAGTTSVNAHHYVHEHSAPRVPTTVDQTKTGEKMHQQTRVPMTKMRKAEEFFFQQYNKVVEKENKQVKSKPHMIPDHKPLAPPNAPPLYIPTLKGWKTVYSEKHVIPSDNIPVANQCFILYANNNCVAWS
eukprot:13607807-Ditylum_brightwellii.AAC.1